MNKFILLLCMALASSLLVEAQTQPLAIDKIVVEKSGHIMKTYKLGRLVASYKIALGSKPIGHKQQAGDGKTPEGIYYIANKNPHSKFHKSLLVSYPNPTDLQHARKLGVAAGGDIMIHGVGKSFAWLGRLHRFKDWTQGCIAVSNAEIDDLYAATPLGTMVEIRP